MTGVVGVKWGFRLEQEVLLRAFSDLDSICGGGSRLFLTRAGGDVLEKNFLTGVRAWT
jgi:hypothetical protein